jgi:nucleotide-binding universal stress UspA family protein
MIMCVYTLAKKIKNILVPIDGSENSVRGLDEAITIARECKSTITAVYAKSLPAAYALHPLGFVGQAFKKESKKVLDSAKTRAAKKGILLKQKVLDGTDPGYDIIRYANKSKPKFDMIVVGARGRGTVKEMFFGSVSHYIVHKAPMPVLVVK